MIEVRALQKAFPPLSGDAPVLALGDVSFRVEAGTSSADARLVAWHRRAREG
ncbi:MAG: hypothetical protein ACRELA_15095 [Candidatus Rokuibacteriota bacterium]